MNEKTENLEKNVKEMQLEISGLKRSIKDKEQRLEILENKNIEMNKMLINLQEENDKLKEKLKEQINLNLSKDETIAVIIANLKEKRDLNNKISLSLSNKWQLTANRNNLLPKSYSFI